MKTPENEEKTLKAILNCYIAESFCQIKRNRTPLVFIYSISLFILVAILLVSITTGTPVANYTRDPAAIHKVSPFLGILSNLGILLWCATVTVCITSFSLFKRYKSQEDNLFILYSAIISALLLLDDLFMIHDYVAPIIFNFSEKYIYIFYFFAISGYLLRFRPVILKKNFSILALAIGTLGFSIFIDIFTPNRGIQYLIEDGVKFIGIAIWLFFFIRILHEDAVNLIQGKVGN